MQSLSCQTQQIEMKFLRMHAPQMAHCVRRIGFQPAAAEVAETMIRSNLRAPLLSARITRCSLPLMQGVAISRCSGFSDPHFYSRTRFYQREVSRMQLHNTEILFTWSTRAGAAVSQGFIWKGITCATSKTRSLFSAPILPARRLYLLAPTASSSLSRSV